jgi:hypothetical protein
LACSYGGNYKFTHCTFNNNWPSSSQVAVLVNNFFKGAIPEVQDLTAATFNNCIVYGSYSNELILDKKPGAKFDYQFNNCLIKFNDIGTGLANNELYNFIRNENSGNIKSNGNKDPKFFNANLNQLNIDKNSAAFAKGNADYNIPLDIIGNIRTLPPDLGAYQNKAFPK